MGEQVDFISVNATWFLSVKSLAWKGWESQSESESDITHFPGNLISFSFAIVLITSQYLLSEKGAESHLQNE